MAVASSKKKKDDDGEEEIEWTPDQPLEDEEAEEEANSRARAHARYDYLKGAHLEKLKNKGKKKEEKKSFFD